MKYLNSNLTYCMNVHPCETLDDIFHNITRYVMPIKERVCADSMFGVGMWFPHLVASTLIEHIERLKEFLIQNDLYVFTINGFPWGPFHGQAVKQNVYKPDWSDRRRLHYTMDLIDILAALLPINGEGSISTVPITYGKILPEQTVTFLSKATEYCNTVYNKTGKKIYLALEPEPDCYLENTDDVITFFESIRNSKTNLKDYLGICFDTCHFAIQGEDLTQSMKRMLANEIPIYKVQISSAIKVDNTFGDTDLSVLRDFEEPVYLHQTRIFDKKTMTLLNRFQDLGDALDANKKGLWYIHFHVPLYFSNLGYLGSTQTELSPDFLKFAFNECSNIEIETYTLNIMPNHSLSVGESIVKEFQWIFSNTS